MRGRCWGASVVASAVIVVPACDGATDNNRGSETHWLTSCDSDDVCGAGLKCICGACTLPCTDSTACQSLGTTAACAPPSAVEAVCPGETHTSSLCLASCDIAGACSSGLSCIDGVCAPHAVAKPDGGAPEDGGRRSSPSDAGRTDAETTSDAAKPRDGGAEEHAGADAGRGDAATDAAAVRSEGGPAPDGGPDGGTANCKPGYHAVSTGDCKPILFSDDFESGSLPGDWQLWERTFVETGGRINVGNGPRPGFDYGASGNGRGAILATHVGDKTWTDYRLDFDAEVLPAGSFDPYGLSSCTRRFDMYFRVQQRTESWNDPMTTYAIGVQTKTCDQDVQGSVSFASFHGYYCPGVGWGCSTAGEGRQLVTTNTPAIVDGPNHYAVEVVGNVTKFWVNGTLVFDYTDNVVPYPAGASPITFGGIDLEWIWELLGWADNVVVTDMR